MLRHPTSVLGDGEIHPRSDLEGKHAIVLYAVTEDKSATGQILSVALSR